jgi:hypothetical protein
VRWFNEVRMGTLSAPEAARRGILTHADLARQYIDEKFRKNEPSRYADFKLLHPKNPEGNEGKGIDLARLAEFQEFAKVIPETRDADAEKARTKEKEREKRGIDPARLAEAREYAKAIEAARDAENTKVKKDLDHNAGGITRDSSAY